MRSNPYGLNSCCNRTPEILMKYQIDYISRKTIPVTYVKCPICGKKSDEFTRSFEAITDFNEKS